MNIMYKNTYINKYKCIYMTLLILFKYRCMDKYKNYIIKSLEPLVLC